NRRLLMLRRQVRIPARHLDRLMPRQFLNGAEINSGHHKSADKRVPQAMPGEIIYASFPNGSFEPTCARVGEHWAGFLLHHSEKQPHAGVHWQIAPLALLGSWNLNQIVHEIDSLPVEALVLLGAPHSGIQRHFNLWHEFRVIAFDDLPKSNFLLVP